MTLSSIIHHRCKAQGKGNKKPVQWCTFRYSGSSIKILWAFFILDPPQMKIGELPYKRVSPLILSGIVKDRLFKRMGGHLYAEKFV